MQIPLTAQEIMQMFRELAVPIPDREIRDRNDQKEKVQLSIPHKLETAKEPHKS